jgi:hypothetical protein
MGGALALATALVLATGTASAACSNEVIREAQGATGLPSCMALEMISPSKKFGQGALLPSAFTPDGERTLFYSTAGLAETPGLQKPFGDRYVATRGGSGWATAATSPPTEAEIKTGGEPLGGPFAYSGDFTRWALLGGTQAQVGVGIFQVFTGGIGLPLSPLSPKAIPLDDTSDRDVIFSVANLLTMGTSDDLSTSVVGSKLAFIAYVPGDPSGNVNEEPGLYANTYAAYRDESGTPTFKLLTRDEADTGNVYGGRCGSRLGGGGGGVSGGLTQGAIAPDGSRIYLTTRPDQPESVGTSGPPCDTDNPLRIMTFTKTPAGPSVEPLFEGGPTEGDDLFQAASADGEQVYFVTPRSLVASDGDTPAPGAGCGAGGSSSPACDLYIYDATLPEGDRLIQASAGGTGDPDPGENAGVLSSITALSTDGTHAYFVAKGVLTTDPNPEGATAVNGQPNLYLYERNAANPDGRTAFIGTLASGDVNILWGTDQSIVGGAYTVPMIGPTPEQGADGHILLITSKASLTSSDPDGGFRDVFRYDAETETLQILSNPSEEVLPADMEVNSNNRAPHGALMATEGRWASEDGLTVGFATAEQLLPSDNDGAADPYLWKEGQLVRFDGTPLPPIVSADGGEFGFTTASKLLAQDGDSAMDAYLARVDGGFLPPVPPTPCNPLAAGSCQGAPGSAPAVNNATAAFRGPGNQKPRTKPKPKKCKKGQVRRKGKCVKKKVKAKKKAGKGRKGASK